MAKNKDIDVTAFIEGLGDAPVLEARSLTKDYGGGRGIFDVDFSIPRGQTVGYVGTNGSGKSTTIRHLMGFLHPDSGEADVLGMNAWKNAYEIKRYIGYVSGEIAFPGVRTGTEFLSLQAEMAGVKDKSIMQNTIERLQLDTSASLKRMSKGMKQKTALVAALMTNAPVLILDEPTTGLDPLMRDTFVEIMREEKAKGKTIFMSSQLFDEVEQICDRVLLIGGGRIIADSTMAEIENNGLLTYNVEFTNNENYIAFLANNLAILHKDDATHTVTVNVKEESLNDFFNILKDKKINGLTQTKYDFESYFNRVFKEQSEDKNDK